MAEGPIIRTLHGSASAIRIRRFGLSAFLFLALEAVFAAPLPPVATGATLTPRNPAEWIVDSIAARFLPGFVVRTESVRWLDGGGLEIRGLRLVAKSGGREFLFVPRILVRFGLGGLASRTVSEIVVENPVLRLHPDLLDLLPASREVKPQPSGALLGGWSVGGIRCDFGELYASDFPGFPFYLSSRFAFDWKEFGLAGSTAESLHKLLLWSVAVDSSPDFSTPFFSLDRVDAGFTARGLLQEGVIEAVRINGGGLALGEAMEKLLGTPSEGTAQKTGTSPSLAIRLLEIQKISAEFQDEGAVASNVTFDFHSTFRNVSMDSLARKIGAETQLVELADIAVLSPLDPLVRIISLHSVFVYFTIEGIFAKRVARVVILNPTLYLSEDLFVYMENAARRAEGAADETAAQSAGNWVIERLRVEFGRLILGGERLGQIGLPLSFQTDAENVRFDSLSSLRLRSSLEIRPQDFSFPPLQISIKQLGGEMKFAYPPDRGEDNLVNVLRAGNIRWRQFELRDAWLAATFDRRGISAQAGGGAYGGYLNAGLSFFFQKDARWVAWGSGKGVDLASLTNVLAPQNFRMTGPADFTIEVDALASRVERVRGNLNAPESGRLNISKIDDFLEELPPEWNPIKTGAVKAALETLRDFDYSSADARFWYVEDQGRLDLKLPGPRGSRNFEFLLHADESSDGLWKQSSR